jgi:hypothetical protein
MEKGEMTPQPQKYYENRKMIFLAGSFSSAALYAITKPIPTVIEFLNLDYKRYGIKARILNMPVDYYFSEVPISMKDAKEVYVLNEEGAELLHNHSGNFNITSAHNIPLYWERNSI